MTAIAPESQREVGPPEARHRSKIGEIVRRPGFLQNVVLLGALVVVAVLFEILNPNYLSPSSLRAMALAVAPIGVLAAGQTLVVLLGALDISVGAQAGLASCISAMAFTAWGNAFGSMGVAILLGVVIGFFNGVIIVYGRINPIVATLGGLALYKGVAQVITNGSAVGFVGANPVYRAIGSGSFLRVPIATWIFVVVAVIFWIFLNRTDMGRNVYAVGGNDMAARLAGINTNKYIIAAYTVVGVCGGIAGIMYTAKTGSGSPTVATAGYELQTVTAVALGGAVMTGGKGGIGGTVIAIVLVAALNNGLTSVNVSIFWQNIAQGLMLIAAVIIQKARSGERRIGLPT
jgi:ribose transport system permease protein